MPAMRALYPLLLLTYPLILHAGIYFGRIQPAVLYLSFLLCVPLLTAMVEHKRPHIGVWFALMGALSLLLFSGGHEADIVRLMPLVINSLLLWIFASSLMPERTPLITRFARLMRDEMPAPVLIYTRQATVAWAIYFVIMLLLSTLLAIYAPLPLWSLFTNLLSYIFLAVMFLAEFVVRRILVGEYMDYSFIEFIRRMRNVNFRGVLKK